MTKTSGSKSMTIGRRIVITLVVMIALIIGVLQLAERATDSLRLGVEDFLSKMSGGVAEITEMPKSDLFPEIVFHTKGIVIRDREDADRTLVSAEDGYIAMDIWRSFLGSGRFNGFEIRNMSLATDYIFPKKADIVFAGISDVPPHDTSPQLLIEGTYNKLPLMITLEMRRHGKKKLKYDFGNVVPMTFKLGTLEANGYLERKLSSTHFEKITAVRNGHEIVFSLTGLEEEPLNLKANGTVDGIPFSAELTKREGVKTLNIKAADPKAVEKVVGLILGDFGIDKTSKTFMIEVLPLEADSKELDNQ